MRTTLRFSSLDPVVRTTLNLPYCTVPDFYGGGAQALHMHVVYPVPDPAAPGYPVLLWICGGGWECCDPANRLHDLSYFAERGYIVCLAEYRVTGTAPFPAQIQDVKTALRFVRKHARAFRADPDRIALMGDSAGGHLVTLAGLTPGKAEFTGAQWAGVSEAGCSPPTARRTPPPCGPRTAWSSSLAPGRRACRSRWTWPRPCATSRRRPRPS